MGQALLDALDVGIYCIVFFAHPELLSTSRWLPLLQHPTPSDPLEMQLRRHTGRRPALWKTATAELAVRLVSSASFHAACQLLDSLLLQMFPLERLLCELLIPSTVSHTISAFPLHSRQALKSHTPGIFALTEQKICTTMPKPALRESFPPAYTSPFMTGHPAFRDPALSGPTFFFEVFEGCASLG